MGQQPSRVIFIGNISFDLSEQQIIDLFKDVGPILNFKLMFDRETGKPRGFAFCEYADVETANSAIRNLNGYEINGRQLKVDYADQDTPLGQISTGQHNQQNVNTTSPPLGSSNFIPLVATTQHTTKEAINATLSGLSNQQLHELLMHAKNLSLNDPGQAKAFLEANPSVSYALFQSLILMNAVDPRIVQQIMGSSTYQKSTSTSPVPSPSTMNMSEAGVGKEQQEMLQKVLGLTEEQIQALPTEQQTQVRAIKAQFSKK